MVQKKWKSLIALSIAAALWGYAGEAACAEEPAGVAAPSKQETPAVLAKHRTRQKTRRAMRRFERKMKGVLRPRSDSSRRRRRRSC